MSRLVSIGRTAGGVGVTLGVAAAGAAVGFAAERYVVGRSLRGDDPYADEPLGSLRGTAVPVTTSDGVTLHVEVDEPEALGRTRGAPVTVIFIHGYALNQDSWHFQRRDLRGSARLVFWDHRSHGRSSTADRSVTFTRLASDLGHVVDQIAPDGPIVLVGHSMGAMTILALAEERPELFGDRVAGVALIASSTQSVPVPTPGVPGPASRLANRLAPGVVRTLARRPELIEYGRRASSDLSYVITRRYSFVAGGSPSLVEFTAAMNAATSIEVLADFLPLFADNDQAKGLEVVAGLPTLIVGAAGDKLTPVEHCRAMAEAVPDATYVEIAQAGHMVLFERHDVVTNSIDELISDVRDAAHEKRRWWKRARARTEPAGPRSSVTPDSRNSAMVTADSGVAGAGAA
jgi:pimeloyl-ACP methyl ester carboxylesterase